MSQEHLSRSPSHRGLVLLSLITQTFAVTAFLWLPLAIPADETYLTLLLELVVKHIVLVLAFETTRMTFLSLWASDFRFQGDGSKPTSNPWSLKRLSLMVVFVVALSIFLVTIHAVREEGLPIVFTLALVALGCSALSSAMLVRKRPFLALVARILFLSLAGVLPIAELTGSLNIEGIAFTLAIASLSLVPLFWRYHAIITTLNAEQIHRVTTALLIASPLLFSGLCIWQVLPVQYYLMVVPVMFVLPMRNIQSEGRLQTVAVLSVSVSLVLLTFLRSGSLLDIVGTPFN